jgi:KDO2-lipid IV(A) lauroyltransferase
MKLSSFLQTKPNLFIYQKIGWKIALYYIMILGRLYFLVRQEEKQKIVASLESVFSTRKKKSEIETITKEVFRGIYAHYYEKLFNAYEGITELRSFMEESIESHGLNKLDAALEKGRGVLFVTGHYGGIEYIPIYLALQGYAVSVIMKFSTQQLRETSCARASDLGLKVVDAGQGRGVLGVVIRELRAKRVVFIECDEIEEWKPSSRDRLFFLGKMIGLDRTINLIHRRTGAEVVLGLLHRFSLHEYALVIEDHHDILSRIGRKASSIGEALLKSFEQLIYQDPEQWYQWKKYADIDGAQLGDLGDNKTITSPILPPAYGDAM